MKINAYLLIVQCLLAQQRQLNVQFTGQRI